MNQQLVDTIKNGIHFKLVSSDDAKGQIKCSMSNDRFIEIKRDYLSKTRGKRFDPAEFMKKVQSEIMDTLFRSFKEELSRKIYDMNMNADELNTIDGNSEWSANIIWAPQIDVKPAEMTGLTKYVVDEELSEEFLNSAKEMELQNSGPYADSEEPVKYSDLITVEWSVKLNDNEDWEEIEGSSMQILLGEKPRLKPALEEKLVGTKVGDIVTETLEIDKDRLPPQMRAYRKQIEKNFGGSIGIRLFITKVQAKMPKSEETWAKERRLDSEEAKIAHLKGIVKYQLDLLNLSSINSGILDQFGNYEVQLQQDMIDSVKASTMQMIFGDFDWKAPYSDEQRDGVLKIVYKNYPALDGMSIQEIVEVVDQVSPKMAKAEFIASCCLGENIPEDKVSDRLLQALIAGLIKIEGNNLRTERGKIIRQLAIEDVLTNSDKLTEVKIDTFDQLRELIEKQGSAAYFNRHVEQYRAEKK